MFVIRKRLAGHIDESTQTILLFSLYTKFKDKPEIKDGHNHNKMAPTTMTLSL